MQLNWADDVPGDIKQTQWEEDPSEPRFRVKEAKRGVPQREILFAPRAWSSHRRTMQGPIWPAKDIGRINFADIQAATDLTTGEVLDRVGLWHLVLEHREDSPPWYVQWADQHLMVLCLVVFARQELGKFQSSMRAKVNMALLGAGHVQIDDEGFKSIIQSVREGYDGWSELVNLIALLSERERDACLILAKALLIEKSKEPSVAESIFQQTPAS